MDDWAEWERRAPAAPPLDGKRFHVFLSHRTSDRTWVTAFRNILERRGFRCFHDYAELMPGGHLTAELEAALGDVQSGLLVWTDATAGSEWVEKEWREFLRLEAKYPGFTFIPVKLTDDPLPPELGDFTFADFSDGRHGSAAYKVVQLMYVLRGEKMPKEFVDLEFEPDIKQVTGSDTVYRRRDGALAGQRAREPEIHRVDAAAQQRIGTNPVPFVGRKKERETLLAALSAPPQARYLALIGTPGVGKRSLVRHVVEEISTSGAKRWTKRFPDGIGIVPDIAPTAGVLDVRYSLWSQFFRTDGNLGASPDAQVQQLRGIRALVVLPDTQLSAGALSEIAALVPESRVVVTAEDPAVAGDVPPVVLPPLTEKQALRVFGHEISMAVPDDAAESVGTLLRLLEGRPGLIRTVGSRALHDCVATTPAPEVGSRLRAWADDLASHGSLEPLLRSLLPREALGALLGSIAAGPDIDLPRAVLVDLAEGNANAVDDAVMLGALVRSSPRGRAHPSYAAAFSAVGPDAAGADEGEAPITDIVRDRVLASGLDWAFATRGEGLFDDRAFVIRLLEWCIEQDRWEEVIALGDPLEESLSIRGRHGSWGDVLDHMLTASQQVEDPETEVQTRVKLAAHADAVGGPHAFEDSYEHLRAAVDKGKPYDIEAVSVARDNLRLLPLGLTSVLALLAALVALAGLWAVIGASDPVQEGTVLDIEPELVAVPLRLDGDRLVDLDGREVDEDGHVFDDDGRPVDGVEYRFERTEDGQVLYLPGPVSIVHEGGAPADVTVSAACLQRCDAEWLAVREDNCSEPVDQDGDFCLVSLAVNLSTLERGAVGVVEVGLARPDPADGDGSLDQGGDRRVLVLSPTG